MLLRQSDEWILWVRRGSFLSLMTCRHFVLVHLLMRWSLDIKAIDFLYKEVAQLHALILSKHEKESPRFFSISYLPQLDYDGQL